MKKETKGITLIALVITIIVLLILVGIAITMLTGDNSILKRAGDAKNEQTIASEKELIKLGYDAYIIDKSTNSSAGLKVQDADVEGSEEEGGWTITFSKTTGNVYMIDEEGNMLDGDFEEEIAKIRAGYKKYVDDRNAISQQIEAKRAEILRRQNENNNAVNQDDLDILTRYCIGDNDKDLLNDILDISAAGYKFKGHEPIPKADEELIYEGLDQREENNKYLLDIYFTYKEKTYRLTSEFVYEITDDNYSYSYPTKEVSPAVYTAGLEEEIANLTRELEKINLEVEDARVKTNEEGWEIIFDNTEHKYTLSLDGNSIKRVKYVIDIEKYFLGADGQGKKWNDLISGNNKFKDDPDSIDDASSILKLVNGHYSHRFVPTENSQGKWEETWDIYYYYVECGKKVYRISLVDKNPGSSIEYHTTKVEKCYTKKGKEGTTVQYSTDGSNNKTDWVVLYDNGETVDIVSLNSMGSFTLGVNDTEATNDTNESDEAVGKCINSYNNAIERINNYCKSLITNPTAKQVRNFGTKPDFSDDTSEMFYSNRTIDWHSSYNGILKIYDFNSEQDLLRANYYDVSCTGEDYWVSERWIYPSYGSVDGENGYKTLTNFRISLFRK